MTSRAYRVFGMSPSYFTRKLTGYLDYKGIPWLFRRFQGLSEEATAAGWPGGVPVVRTPEGELMWDSTAVIHHLELLYPEPSVLPPNPAQRFLCYVIEDAADEWLYRPAVGSRWHFPENTAIGSVEIARDVCAQAPMSCDAARSALEAHMHSTLPGLGVTAGNVRSWIDEILRPWMRVLGAHLGTRPYLFGGRPSLADFGLFGGDAAHFVRDPLCRRWADEDAPAVVRHTYRLLEPQDQIFGDWDEPGAVGGPLIAVLADLGRFYLPWVSRACRDGTATVRFASGATAEIRASDFLRQARATLLARYREYRSPGLDAVLERAGILGYFADFVADAGAVPDFRDPPRPALNRPYGPAEV